MVNKTIWISVKPEGFGTGVAGTNKYHSLLKNLSETGCAYNLYHKNVKNGNVYFKIRGEPEYIRNAKIVADKYEKFGVKLLTTKPTDVKAIW